MASSGNDVTADPGRRRSQGLVNILDEHGRRKTVTLDELASEDRELAEKFGYKPVFKREFGWLSTFSFAVSISALYSTIMTTFYYPLLAGGSASAVWCWLISGFGCMCIACSVAELVSAYPTSGGLYYTVSHLAPVNWVPSISWVTGWLNLLGQVAGIASSEYGGAQMLLAAVAMGSGYDEVNAKFNYVPTAGHTVGVMAALTVVTGMVNSLSTKWMEKMTKTYVIFHVIVLISCCITLLVVTPTEKRNNATYVFTHIESDSGWTPIGWSFLFGFLSVSWTMTDYDATAHITEEIIEPEVKAPWAISTAMLFTYVAGFLFNIVLCFCMGDPVADAPDGILNSTLGQPVAQLFYNSLGPAGGIVFTVCAFIIIQFLCFAATQALARTVFAFARDKLVPFSNVWTIVNPLTGTPLYAVWISIFFCIAINLIGLASYAAIAGVFGVTAIALDWSYCIPILCKMFGGRWEKPGPWHMGKIGWYVNAWAVIWTLFASVIFILPTIMPVTGENMNYSVAFLALILVFSTIYWYAGGRRFYTGPLCDAEVTEIEGEERSSGSDSERMADRKGDVTTV